MEQILLDTLEDALTKDSDAKGGITVNESNEIATVSFQSGQMSTLFRNIVGRWYLQCKHAEQGCLFTVLW